MPRSSSIPFGSAVTSVLGILAAWIAADSCGVVGRPLSNLLVAVILGLVLFLAWPKVIRSRIAWWPIVMLGIPIAVSPTPEFGMLLIVTVFSLLATTGRRKQRALSLTCAVAILVFAVFQVVERSSSWVWLSTDFLSGLFARLTQMRVEPSTAASGGVGTTYGGIDFLVLSTTFTLIWIVHPKHGLSRACVRVRRTMAALASILAGHLLYLSALSQSHQWKSMLPITQERPFKHPYVPPPWEWSDTVAHWLPWNVPVIAAIIHLVIVFFIIRWFVPVRWPVPLSQQVLETQLDSAKGTKHRDFTKQRPWWSTNRMAYICTALLAVSATLDRSENQCNLTQKRVLASNGGRLDWQTPEHDKYGQASAGMFGILPKYVASLGGSMSISDTLTADELNQADALLLLHPTFPISEDKLQRIWNFVDSGGSLLLAAEPYVYDAGVESCFNEILAPTSIRVRRDVAISAVGDWQYALNSFAHSVNAGSNQRVRSPFTDSGSSLSVRFPATPLVVGRWGWSDPGSEALTSGIYKLDEGERLGDVVLLAEQRMGHGKVLVLGDSTCLTNEGLVHNYEFAGRLLSYLASSDTAPPQVEWRQVTTLLLSILVVFYSLYRTTPNRIAAMAFTLAVSLSICDWANRTSAACIPYEIAAAQTTNESGWNQIAYIDSSHVEAYSNSEWGFDATNGLALTLMRNRYLTFRLPELTSERLEQARLVVSIAPAKSFTPYEIQLVDQFVSSGGIWISTVGAEQSAGSEGLLAHFGFRVPHSPVHTLDRSREPEPMGHFRSEPASTARYTAGVTFYAGWPIEFDGGDMDALVSGTHGRAIVGCRKWGLGSFVLIGDSGFAMNKNLEYIGGEPFEHGYENAEFWRWLIHYVPQRGIGQTR